MSLKLWRTVGIFALVAMPAVFYVCVSLDWERRGVSPVSGDEPHYLIVADAIATDHSLRVGQAYGRDAITGQTAGQAGWQSHTRATRYGTFSTQSIGLPALVAPAFRWFGVRGVRVMLGLIVGLVPVLFFGIARQRGLLPLEAIVLAVGSSLGLPFLAGSGQIYPDLVSGVVLLGAAYAALLHSTKTARLRVLALAGVLVAMLPWLHASNVPAAVVLGVTLVIIELRGHRARAARLGWLVGPPACSLALLALYNGFAFGSIGGPGSATGVARASAGQAAMIVLGLHLDQAQGLFVQQPLFLLGLPGLALLWSRQRLFAVGAILTYLAVIVPSAFDGCWYGCGTMSGTLIWSVAALWFFPLVFLYAELRKPGRVLMGAAAASAVLWQLRLMERWASGGPAAMAPDLLLRNSLLGDGWRAVLPSFHEVGRFVTCVPNLVAEVLVLSLVASGFLLLLPRSRSLRQPEDSTASHLTSAEFLFALRSSFDGLGTNGAVLKRSAAAAVRSDDVWGRPSGVPAGEDRTSATRLKTGGPRAVGLPGLSPGAHGNLAPKWRAVGRSWFWAGMVIALFCVPLFVGLGRTDLENDEAIYSFAVDTMISNGDWLTPRSSPSETAAFLEKPPLKFWIVAAPIRFGLLPANEFGLRFWDALFGSIAFLYVFAIGRRFGGTLCGFAAVLVLFAHRPLLFEHGLRSNTMEAALVLSYCGAMWHFLAWRASARGWRPRLQIVAIVLYFVLGFMMKFVAASFLPVVLASVTLVTAGDRARLRRDWAAWFGSGLLAAGLIAPWFLYQYRRVGRELWDTMFGMHVYERFTAYLDPAHLHPWHYYLSRMFAELSGSGAAAVAIAGLALVFVQTVRRRWPEGVLILLWFGLPLTLISAVTSKLYHYTYPFLPAAALAAGYAVAVLFRFVRSLLAPVTPSRLGAVVPAYATLVVLFVLPLGAYRRDASLLTLEHHPLRDVRDCLQPICASHPTADDRRGPGVWVEANSIAHAYYYYLRNLGPFELRDVASDPTVYMYLHAPSRLRPIVLSNDRFDEYMRLVRSGDRIVIERAARKAGVDPSMLLTDADATAGPSVRFADAVLLLPGPYSACAAGTPRATPERRVGQQ